MYKRKETTGITAGDVPGEGVYDRNSTTVLPETLYIDIHVITHSPLYTALVGTLLAFAFPLPLAFALEDSFGFGAEHSARSFARHLL